ncbi:MULTISPECIES: DUF402 domain-containing protein [unclassified Microbacterium]|uniref:DUF402 domain-containing protein n=1 Tax=unclassified Microbacterium TaxID=2609290 RepID=UPI00214C6FFC|nr:MULTISPECIES: DUF402 domain-containing protein [unclassified Microbacterium]MCR2783737.1 hypothetical protein [Microbacterium sp. zg.B96]WIM15410.1 hypothetical protein QNO11_12825 [Microbacterium sp. zg-B96]
MNAISAVSARPAPGTPLLFRWRKWDGGAHWVHECVYLGSDRWGDWVGQRVGDRSVRPGRDIPAPQPNVTLIPPDGDWVFTTNAPPHRTHIYIDLAWDVTWIDGEPGGIDMDLDVVQRVGADVYIEDRDEWDEHRVAYGYPLDIVDRLERVAVDLETRVRNREAPFDETTAQHWLDRLAAGGEPPIP